MKRLTLAALGAACALLSVTSAHAVTTITGVPYDPTGMNGNEYVAETITVELYDPDEDFLVSVTTMPAAPGYDRAGLSVTDPEYDITFSDGVKFDLANSVATNTLTGAMVSFTPAQVAYEYVPGTDFVDGNNPTFGGAFFSYKRFDNILSELSITPVAPGGTIDVTSITAYAPGVMTNGGAGFGPVTFPGVAAAVPEPTTWGSMLLGLVLVSVMLRRKQGAIWAKQGLRMAS